MGGFKQMSAVITVGLILLSTSKADSNSKFKPQIASFLNNYYDQGEFDEPLFREKPSVDENGVPEQFPPPLDIMADTRFPDSEPTWEMNLSGKQSSLQKRSSNDVPTINEGSLLPDKAKQRLVRATIKRAEVATTLEELNSKRKKESEESKTVKRTVGEHYWTCRSTHEWENLGADHYPRYVKSARCDTQGCANGLFACVPRKYKVKVLKRFALSDSPIPQETNDDLPEELRFDWKLKTIEITHCCECSNAARII